MAPSDDNNLDDDSSSVKLTGEQPLASSALPKVSSEANGSLKNIASAINYELPMVNQFLAVHQDLRRRNFSLSVEIRTKSTQEFYVVPDNHHIDQLHEQQPPPTTATSKNGRRTSNMENNTPNVLDRRGSDVDVSSVAIGHESHQQQTQQNQGCSSPTSSKNALSNSSTHCNPVKEQQHEQSTLLLQSPVPTTMQKRRVSTREKQKREIPLSRSRVKYDMQLVPFVRRNPLFLQQFIPPWWLSNMGDVKCKTTLANQDEGGANQPSQLPTQHRRSSRFVSTPALTTESIQQEIDPPQPCRCHGAVDSTNQNLLPFAITERYVEGESVIWAPNKRSEWEDTISEMTAVYTAAAFRRHTLDLVEKQQQLQRSDPPGNVDGTAAMATNCSNEPFAKPLSIDYIRDRIDIDDPLYGYQVRHKFGGWMQGFILYTTFTTWNFGFEFNSQHPLCGISPPPSDAVVSDVDYNRYVDYDNSLAMELEALPRSGDPSVGGIVFSEIAEISILGALGCGEYLLRMALDDIYTNKQNYKYVILHAADQARAFYEKFGFKRVGAVCKYSKKQNIPLTPTPNILPEPPQVLGYRHWTHANEAILHDAPSYMMCLKLPDRSKIIDDNSVDSCLECRGIISRPPRPGDFLRQMLQFQVPSKPRIEPLGTSTVLGLKHLSRRCHSMPLVATSSSFESQSSCPNMTGPSNLWTNHTAGKRGNAIMGTGTKISRRKSLACGTLTKSLSFRSSDVPLANLSMRTTSLNPVNGSLTNASRKSSKSDVKRPPSWKDAAPTNHRPTKRLKVERTLSSTIAHESVPKRSSFVEKQYNSVWLAVPPNVPGAASPHRERAPPKSRTDAVVVAHKSRRKFCGSAGQMYETSGRNRTMLPVIEEADEHATTNEQSRPKRSMFHYVSKDEEATGKHSSTLQPPMKISRKRTFTDSIAKSEKMKTSNSKDTAAEATETSPSPPRRSIFEMMTSEESASSIDTINLRKQKVLSYPRNRTHYYNRVVRENVSNVDGTATSCTKGNDDATCYFVLEYEEDKGLICIVPMIVRGILTGKRLGRPRYQCQMDHKFSIVEADKFYIVPSAMIMKTPMVAQEAWDIATDSDTEFLTR